MERDVDVKAGTRIELWPDWKKKSCGVPVNPTMSIEAVELSVYSVVCNLENVVRCMHRDTPEQMAIAKSIEMAVKHLQNVDSVILALMKKT